MSRVFCPATMIPPTCIKVSIQHSLLGGEAEQLRVLVVEHTTFDQLTYILTDRLEITLPKGVSLRFESLTGDGFAGMDRVHDLVDEHEVLVAKLVSPKPASIPSVSLPKDLHIGLVAPAVEPAAPEAIVAQPEEHTGECTAPEKCITLTLNVPDWAVGAVIGTKGRNIKRLEKDFKVKVDVDSGGRCRIQAWSQQDAMKAEDSVLQIIKAQEQTKQWDEQRKQWDEQRKLWNGLHRAANALTEGEATQSLTAHNRMKTLRQKLSKIRAIKKRVADKDPWLQQSELALLDKEQLYSEELVRLRETQGDRLPAKVLKERLKKGANNFTPSAENRKLEAEYGWHNKRVVAVVDLSKVTNK